MEKTGELRGKYIELTFRIAEIYQVNWMIGITRK